MSGQIWNWIDFIYYSIIDLGWYFTAAACMEKSEKADVLKLVETSGKHHFQLED